MKTLSDNWLTDGLLDFEYKKYILLAYLQAAKQSFEHQELYPTFSDLVFHYKNLVAIKEGKELLYQKFPKKISKADFQKLHLSYQHIANDDETMKELTDIVLFSLPKFEARLAEGKELYDLVAKQIVIEPVGLASISPEEGYVFLQPYMQKETSIYQYKMTIFESAEEKYRGIHLNFLERIRKGIGQTFEQFKLELVRKYQTFSNPATYLLRSQIPCPFEETLLPVSKRLLMIHIAHQ